MSQSQRVKESKSQSQRVKVESKSQRLKVKELMSIKQVTFQSFSKFHKILLIIDSIILSLIWFVLLLKLKSDQQVILIMSLVKLCKGTQRCSV